MAIIPLPIGPGWKPLEMGGNTQIALTGLKLALLGGIVAAGIFPHVSTPAHWRTKVTPVPGGFAGFFKALVAALWAYDGLNNAGMLGSEIERPGRNLPRAVIGGTLAVIGVYLAANLAYFSALSSAEVAGSERVAADMMRRIAGVHGEAAAGVAVMISIFAALNGSLLSGSRMPFALGRGGYFFSSAGRVHPRFRTPSTAIALLGAWSSIVLLSGHYDELYTLVIFPSWILYAMTAASVLVLRHKLPSTERPYRVLGYPVVPLMFVLVAMALPYSTPRTSPRESGIGFAVIASGLPFDWPRRRGAAGFSPEK